MAPVLEHATDPILGPPPGLTGENAFYAVIDSAVPNWESLQENPKWDEWISEPELSAAFAEASKSLDHETMVTIFLAFMSEVDPDNYKRYVRGLGVEALREMKMTFYAQLVISVLSVGLGAYLAYRLHKYLFGTPSFSSVSSISSNPNLQSPTE